MQKDKVIKYLVSIGIVVFSIAAYGCSTGNEEDYTNSVIIEKSTEEDEKLNDELTDIVSKDSDVTDEMEPENQSVENDNSQEEVYVYICGEINSPGVYKFSKNARIYEAIEAAGGITEFAGDFVLNQAQILNDCDKIYVPTIEEAQQMQQNQIDGTQITGDSNNVSDNVPGLININTATSEMLMSLPGVGQSKANSIISYREKNGGFKSIEEIMQIEGIKEGVYSKLKDLITVN